MANAEDFTYSNGYLGLLTMLGASLGIALCCVPCSILCTRAVIRWRKSRPHGWATGIHRDIEKNIFRTRATRVYGRWTLLRTMMISSLSHERTVVTTSIAGSEDSASVLRPDPWVLAPSKSVEDGPDGPERLRESIVRRWSI